MLVSFKTKAKLWFDSNILLPKLIIPGERTSEIFSPDFQIQLKDVMQFFDTPLFSDRF
jgi:hypothetical protein